MGVLCSSPKLSPEDREELRKNLEIEKKQKQDSKRERSIVKLLLLGAGESGKSTIFKQLKQLYGIPWSKEELEEFIPSVRANIVTNMLSLLRAADKFPDISFENEEKRQEFIGNYKADSPLTPEMQSDIKEFWEDPAASKLWERRSQFQILDCLEYYMKPENFDRISSPDYVPIPMDIFQARIRTTGIIEDKYEIDGVEFNVFDVGGQRNERKKWIHAFEGVTALVFVAAINEYDQVLLEDGKTNRHEEALKLFEDVANSKWFEKSSIVLFLNKDDLFRAKLRTTPFRVEGVRFEDFKGPYYEQGMSDEQFEECVQAAQRYLIDVFLAVVHDKQVYAHVSCATDSGSAQVVFEAAKDTILKHNLRNVGAMF